MLHLHLEPLDPNTNLDDINIDLSGWEFGFEDLPAGHPHPSINVNAPVLASAEAHSRREKRVREEEIGESSPKRSRIDLSNADPPFYEFGSTGLSSAGNRSNGTLLPSRTSYFLLPSSLSF